MRNFHQKCIFGNFGGATFTKNAFLTILKGQLLPNVHFCQEKFLKMNIVIFPLQKCEK